MVFGEDGPFGIRTGGQGPKRLAGQLLFGRQQRHACGLQDRRICVHKRDGRRHGLTARHVRAGDDERNVGGFVVEREFARQAACAQGFAMVGRVDDAGVVV